MKMWITVNGSGFVTGAGTDPEELKRKAEKSIGVDSISYEWEMEYGGRERLFWRRRATGRRNSIPARYLDSVDVDVDECNYDCDRCNPDGWSDQEDEG